MPYDGRGGGISSDNIMQCLEREIIPDPGDHGKRRHPACNLRRSNVAICNNEYLQWFSVFPQSTSPFDKMSQSGKTEDMMLRKAFEGIIAVLGPAGKDAIVRELKLRCDYEQEYISTEPVADILRRLFGADSADLLLEQVRKVEQRLGAKIAKMETEQNLGRSPANARMGKPAA